ncbi:ABC transporter permease [Sphaerochaeta sp. PS]|uniref:ABC transporter permease n=1 Tax=Sphaerochaeta sp. PS TaxID=3076336 RepID=UPI0028A440F9|nr:ABC transporter permease [Sphaerochaeta sp. PS]MDT4761089.1 ABC transporter permease [Sphaerochaeta sp. PS]
MKSIVRKLTKTQIFWPLVIFLGILALNGLISGGSFFRLQIVDGHLYGRIIDIFRNGSKLMLLALGMTMVLATGGTDISVGSVMAISGAVACTIIEGSLFPFANGSVVFAIAAAIFAGVLCGSWNGFLVSRIQMQPIVATMILLVAGRGIAQLICKGRIVTINSPPFYFINGGYILGLPFPVYIVVALSLLVLLVVRKTAFGLYVESVGCNGEASRYSGINSARIKFFIYILCGTLAAVAGLIESAGIKGADANNAGLMIELDAILAVAIGGSSLSGGRFSLLSSLVGALIIQSITTSILSLGIAPEVNLVVKAVVVIAICLAQSPVFQQSISAFRAKIKKQEVVA